jgi:hypothetical protein
MSAMLDRPPEAMTGMVSACASLTVASMLMPTEHAVAANVGVNDGFDAVVLKLLAQVDHVVAGQLAPAVGGHFAVLASRPDDDVAAKRGAGILQKTGVLDRCRADDDVAQAGVEVALNGVQVADAAAQLHIDFAAHFFENLA